MPPSLSQVLASGGSNPSFSFTHLALGVAVICAGIFTLAKGIDLYRRRLLSPVLSEKELDTFKLQYQERIEKLSFMIEELTREKNELLQKNEELGKQLRQIDEQKQIVEILRKSNLSLMKECEKLKAEKEKLLLDCSLPLIKVKKKRTAKKEIVRKPKRVSRKGK
ncbi:MAG: hypothetical protein ACPL4K_04835 [Candidatus Margulisiibacteriota bacterium]